MTATTRIYLDDAYCFEHDAEVKAANGNALLLDQTCFYPGGGGQPPDTGRLTFRDGSTLEVTGISEDDCGGLWHLTDAPADGNSLAGRECRAILDVERRRGLMRYHTALHIFNTVMLREHNGWITGVQIGADGSRIDFALDEFRPEMAPEIEALVNDVVAQHLPVRAYQISEGEFRNRPDLLRTLEAQPPVHGGAVRVVEIVGFEAQACGGTHVANTDEIGPLSITKIRSKGRQNRRFYVELGPPAATPHC